MYNPYDLIPMCINGVETFGRPVEFDSEIVDFDKMENAFGHLVKPKKLSTTCPSCGQGLLVEVKLLDPPFSTIYHTCELCMPKRELTTDPFSNPVESGRVESHELDPLLYNPHRQTISAEPVAKRVDLSQLASVVESSKAPPKPVVEDQAAVDEDLVKTLKARRKPKKSPKKTTKENPRLEPAEDLDEERFDDADLAEPE